jgi:two-component system, response regulator, stage 0 sporulation protein F
MRDQDQSGRAPAIIVVDDDPEMLRLIRLSIRGVATGYEIVTCARGDVALERATQQPVALVITDYNLPGMNGLQLTAALKARTPAIQVVLISAHATADLVRRAHDRGVNLLLPKPFQVDMLIQIVQAALA